MVPTSLAANPLAARRPARRHVPGGLSRARLMGSVSALALTLAVGTWLLAAPAAADRECGDPVDGVVTCRGTPATDGVVYNPDAADLTINVVAGTTITENNGASGGIRVPGTGREATGRIVVNLDDVPPGAQGTTVSSSRSDGIFLDLSAKGSAAVRVGAGVTITGNADVGSAVNIGTSEGPIKVDNYGQLAGRVGINASSAFGELAIGNAGRIDAGVIGIDVQSNGNITVSNAGRIEAGQFGIGAYSRSREGTIIITTEATSLIRATTLDGIRAIVGVAGSAGAITIANDGTVFAGRDSIYAKSQFGATTITNAGLMTGGNSGINAVSELGTISITNYAAGTIGAGTDGLRAVSTGGGNDVGAIEMTNAGMVFAGRDGIYALSQFGATTITNTGAITADRDGIFACSGSRINGNPICNGSGSIKVENTGAITAGGFGIYGRTAQGTVSITTLPGETSVIDAALDGIRAITVGTARNADAGAITIAHAGTIHAGVDGIAGGNGISAESDFGTIGIKTERTSVIGTADRRVGYDGISAITVGAADNAGIGAITITHAGKIDARHSGIVARSTYGTISVRTEATSAISNPTSGSEGITAVTVGSADNADAGAITIDHAGAISAGGFGISTNSRFGKTKITNTGTIEADLDRVGIVSSNTFGGISIYNAGRIAADGGIFAVSFGQGPISITTLPGDTSVIEAANFDGIYAVNRGAAGNAGAITIAHYGTINAGRDGIRAESQFGTLTIYSAGRIAGKADAPAGRYGIYAKNDQGTISITTLPGETSVIEATLDGIHAVSVGAAGNPNAGAITIAHAGTIRAGRDGISTYSQFGATTITNAGAITAGRYGDGIVASSSSGNITVGNAGSITAGFNGIFASSSSGPITIGNTGAITAGISGIFAYNLSGNITIGNAGSITAGLYGISASSDFGTIKITTDTTSVIGTADLPVGYDGIRAVTVGAAGNPNAGAITIAHAGTINANRTGILTASQYGATTITHAGTINALLGITAYSREGAISITTAATSVINATSAGGIGIAVENGIGPTTIFSAGQITAGQDGIFASSRTGNITVGNAGPITAGRYGILADTGGNITVGIAGRIDAGFIGIHAETGQGTIDITTGSASVTRGGEVGIQAYSLTGTTIRNFGSITAGLARERLAIESTGAATTLYNAGTIEGRIRLTENKDKVINTRLFSAAGTSEFRGGGDVFLNDRSGTVSLLGNATSAHFSGLARFENAGLVTMGNGRAGDTIVLSDAAPGGASFAVLNGGRLAVDVSLGGPNPTADKLVVDGAIVGPGTNTIVIRGTSQSGPASFAPVIPVVIVDFDPNKVHPGVSSPTNAFVVAPGSGDLGFFSLNVVLDTANEDWVLASRPDASILELPSIVSAAQSLWHTSTGAWLERTADLRGPRGGECSGGIKDDDPVACPGGRLGAWAKAFGKRLERSQDTQTAALDQQTTSDIRYGQNSYGFVGGFDGAVGDRSPWGGGGWVVGVMAGSTNSSVAFHNSRTRVDLEGGLIGGYATYLNGGLFLSAMLAANVGEIDYNGGGPEALQGSGSARFRSAGATLDTGYRMPFAPGFFLEPGATLAYVNTHIDDLKVFGHTVNFGDGESLRGRLGVRVGTTLVGGGLKYEPFLGASAWYEFLGDNRASLVSNGVLFSAADDTGGLIGEVSAGVNVFSLGTSGVSGFAKGNFQWGEKDYHSLGGEVGVRIQW